MVINKDKSLKENISLNARAVYPKWLNGGDFERLAFDMGYKPSNASRRARELENDNILKREERKTTGVKSVFYQYVPTEHEIKSWSMQKLLESDKIYIYGKEANPQITQKETLVSYQSASQTTLW